MRTGTITLSLPTVLTMVRLRGGEPHPTLADTPAWRSAAALAELEERARVELAGSPEFGDVLDALLVPREEYYGWLTTSEAGRRVDYRVLAVAGAGIAAVLTVGADELVTIAPARPTGLLAELVMRLPEHPPARGRALNVPKADYDRVLAGEPVRGGDLGAIGELVRAPRAGGGSLYSALRPAAGGRRRVPRPVTYLDTPTGRWLTQVTTNASREQWVTFAPASRDLLATRVAEQHRRLTD